MTQIEAMTELNMEGIYRRDWLAPGAPIDYGPGRRCTRGQKCKTYEQTGMRDQPEIGKVHRYVEPYLEDKHGNPTILFCEACEKDRLRADRDPESYQGGASFANAGRYKSVALGNLRELRNARGLRVSDLAERLFTEVRGR